MLVMKDSLMFPFKEPDYRSSDFMQLTCLGVNCPKFFLLISIQPQGLIICLSLEFPWTLINMYTTIISYLDFCLTLTSGLFSNSNIVRIALVNFLNHFVMLLSY